MAEAAHGDGPPPPERGRQQCHDSRAERRAAPGDTVQELSSLLKGAGLAESVALRKDLDKGDGGGEERRGGPADAAPPDRGERHGGRGARGEAPGSAARRAQLGDTMAEELQILRQGGESRGR
ncbi:unnamed protein product [Prorocentrum cordatum]|uniref:Uncharacterized protein n=1 Tax=Prorocentrum cordatum TaxID=2364126 RepID=A0ABN9Y6P6_9DINO|nr:unnamed protein product [Polarella glacialis]